MPNRLVFLLCLIAGCGRGSPGAQVEGRLTQKGEPLTDVIVTFMPEPDQGDLAIAMGTTDAEGYFQLKGADDQPGVSPGRHRVILREVKKSLENPAERLKRKGTGQKQVPAPVAKPRIPPEYQASATTPLKREVVSGQQTIDLDLP